MAQDAAHSSSANGSPIIEVEHASVVASSGADILQDISFFVSRGQHTALLGPNGAGKTSLIRLITQHYRAFTGAERKPTVRLFGRERWDVFALRSHLGVVSYEQQQEFITQNGHLRGKDVVLTSFFASRGLFRHQKVSPSMRERSGDVLAQMGADHLARKPLEEMSQGEARRVLIARALAPDPAALLLDEPTSGLDVVARRRFLETVRQLARSGRTVILATHHIEEIFPEIGRVILLDNGTIVENADKEDVLTSSVLTKTYGAALQVRQLSDGYYRSHVVSPDPAGSRS